MTPPLPTPHTVEGNRLMYTRAQMIEHREAYAAAKIAEIDAARLAARLKHTEGGQEQGGTVDFLRGMFGMKP